MSNVAPESEVFDTLIKALNEKLETVNGKEENKTVKKIQSLVEKHYKLRGGALDNSFKRKDRELTEAKFMCVVITLHVFKNDRSKVERLISNGLTRQKVYTCWREFDDLNSSIAYEKELKETYKIIIQSYE